MSSEMMLKPCPFCGGEAEELRCPGGSWVWCTACKASSDDSRAVEKWNRRAAPEPPAPAGEVVAELEEALRLAEVGEYLYSSRAYSYGDGYTEPREYGIDWQWQQSKPDEYGQGALLAAAVKWHEEQAEDGTATEAMKLRAALASPPTPDADAIRRAALEEAARMADAEASRTNGITAVRIAESIRALATRPAPDGSA